MVLNDGNENQSGWYVVHTTFKIDDSQELNAVTDIIQSVLPWIVSDVSVTFKRLRGWDETDEFL